MLVSGHGFANALRHVYVRTPAIGRSRFVSPRLKSTTSNADVSKLQEKASPLSGKIRALMRTHPHSVAAVVAPSDIVAPDVSLSKDGLATDPKPQSALLVSSFNTVTLSPIPYVSFNIKTPGSKTYESIRTFGTFTVSGLGDPGTAHAFVEKFEDHELKQGREVWRACIGEEGKVKKEKGGRWWLLCKHHAGMSTRVGDHIILVGEVLNAGSHMEEEDGEQVNTSELVYLDGKYRWIGKVAKARSLRQSAGPES